MIVPAVVLSLLLASPVIAGKRRLPSSPPGECRSNSDCSKWSPYCSDFGFCQWTDKFGSHPEKGETVDTAEEEYEEYEYPDVFDVVTSAYNDDDNLRISDEYESYPDYYQYYNYDDNLEVVEFTTQSSIHENVIDAKTMQDESRPFINLEINLEENDFNNSDSTTMMPSPEKGLENKKKLFRENNNPITNKQEEKDIYASDPINEEHDNFTEYYQDDYDSAATKSVEETKLSSTTKDQNNFVKNNFNHTQNSTTKIMPDNGFDPIADLKSARTHLISSPLKPTSNLDKNIEDNDELYDSDEYIYSTNYYHYDDNVQNGKIINDSDKHTVEDLGPNIIKTNIETENITNKLTDHETIFETTTSVFTSETNTFSNTQTPPSMIIAENILQSNKGLDDLAKMPETKISKESKNKSHIQVLKRFNISLHLRPPPLQNDATKKDNKFHKIERKILKNVVNKTSVEMEDTSHLSSASTKQPKSHFSLVAPSEPSVVLNQNFDLTSSNIQETERDIFNQCPGDSLKSCIDACLPLQNNFVYGVCVRECSKRCP